MTKLNYSLTKINSNERQYIRASAPVWDDGIKMGEKVGFIEVQPEAAEKSLKKFESGELSVSFGSEILIAGVAQGIYNIEVSKVAVAAGTLEHA